MLTLRHIEIFHAVYVSGSVSAAARILNISQPSVTKVVQHAESVLGFKLFDRRGGRLVPTEDAHAMQAEADDIVDRVQGLRKKGMNLRSGRGGTIRVSALPSLSLAAVPAVAAKFLSKNQNVALELFTLHHEDIARKLFERESDVAIAFEVPKTVPVRATAIGRGELVVFFRKQDCPDIGEFFPVEALAERKFISVLRSGPIGLQLESEFKRKNIVPDEVASVRTFYVAGALVKAGLGVAVLDRFTAHALRDAQTDFRSLEHPLSFDVHAITLESRPPSALLAAFLKQLTADLPLYS